MSKKPETKEWEDVFTEKSLPRGKMILVGRCLNGQELACMIDPVKDRPYLGRVVKDLHSALQFNK